MSEQDFRDALRKTMDAVTPPPQMSDAPVLAAAHRDRRRRRTLWAAAGSAVVVAGIAVGVVLVAPSKSGGDGVRVGGPQPTSTEDAPRPDVTASATANSGAPEDTKETFPSGMTDRTAKSGPHHERGADLTAALDDVLAGTGYTTPGDLENTGELYGPLKRNQANYDGKVDGAEHWTYSAVTPLVKGGGTGEVMVEVTTASGEASGCDLPMVWGLQGECRELTVDGKEVAFVDVAAGREHIDQFAAYRHDDGTLVYVTQSIDYAYSKLPPLAALPFTPEQLAAMAVDDRFAVLD